MKKKISYREFFESCGLDDDQVEMACAMFDAVKGRALDGVGMGQVLMCMNAFIVHIIREGVKDSEGGQ